MHISTFKVYVPDDFSALHLILKGHKNIWPFNLIHTAWKNLLFKRTDLHDKILSRLIHERTHHQKMFLLMYCVRRNVWLCRCTRVIGSGSDRPRVHVWVSAWANTRMHVTPQDSAIIADLTVSQCALLVRHRMELNPASAHNLTSWAQVIFQSSPDIKPPKPIYFTFNVRKH